MEAQGLDSLELPLAGVPSTRADELGQGPCLRVLQPERAATYTDDVVVSGLVAMGAGA